MTSQTQPKVALVLGGGGNRGVAHVGVLSVLERENIPIDLVIGTSMGGIVGVAFAMGMSAAQILEQMKALMQGSNVFTMNVFSARARQRAVKSQLDSFLGGKTFADLRLPVVLTAVDMVSGQEVTMTEGELIPALLATSAVPAVFPPVEIGGMQLADGGVIDSLAVHVAYAHGADKVIAVDIYPELETDPPWVDPISNIMGIDWTLGLLPTSDARRIPSMMAAIWRSVRVITWHTHQQRLLAHPPDILIRPDIRNIASLDFKDVGQPFEAGVIAAENHLDQLHALLHEIQNGVPPGQPPPDMP